MSIFIFVLFMAGCSLILFLMIVSQDKNGVRLKKEIDRLNQSSAQQPAIQVRTKELEKSLHDKDAVINESAVKLKEAQNEALRLRSDLTSQIEKMNTQFADTEKLAAQLQTLKDEKAVLTEKCTVAQVSAQKENGLQKLVDEKEKALQQKEKEIKDIKAQWQDLSGKVNQKDEEARSQNQTIQNLKADIHQLHETQKNFQEAAKNAETMKIDIEQKDKALKQSETEIQQLKAAIQQLQDAQKNSEEAVQNLEAQKSELGQKLEALKQSEIETQRLKSQIQQLQSAQKSSAEAVQNLELIKNELAQKNEALNQTERDIQNLKQQVRQLNETRASDIQKEIEKNDAAHQAKETALLKLESDILLVQTALANQVQFSKDMRLRMEEHRSTMKLLEEKTKENLELISQIDNF